MSHTLPLTQSFRCIPISLHSLFLRPVLTCNTRPPHGAGGVRIVPVDSGMGIEDWETKYKLHDNLLDDFLEPEQKTWDDDDETKSEIYRIVSDPSASKRSRFYQAVECEVTSSEDNEYDEAVKTSNVRRGEVRLVYKEAGSFEDEISPPEIAIIPSVRQLHQQEADQEVYKESLLYKTRMWAKTHIKDILENYAIYQEKEEARMRIRDECESVGSADVPFSLGSEDDMAFIEEDAHYEYDSYYNSRKYNSFHGERPHSCHELKENVSTLVFDDISAAMGQGDDYIDTMNELQNIVDTVTEYLAGREEEISKYEETHKSDNKSKRDDKEKDNDIKSDEIREETAVEQGITGVKNAMNSLFNSLVGTKSTGETTETTATTTTMTTDSSLPLQTDSGISKLLSFIPKSKVSQTPVAVVPPAHQEPSADKKSPPRSPQSSETNRPASVGGAEDTANAVTSPETQGSTASQSQSVVDSVLGRLSPFRIFGDRPVGEATSQPETSNKSYGSSESKEGLTGNDKTMPVEQSALQPEHQSLCGGSCSGSVELLPDTESSGEIPDAPAKEMTLKPEEQQTADDLGFFSPFKKSLTSFMTTTPASGNKSAESLSGHSVFSIFKPAEAPKPEDVPPSIGEKLKLSFFSSDPPTTPQAPKQDSGLLSGLLKLGPGEEATTSKQGAANTSTKSPLLSRAMLLESVPKGNTDTGWFSNLFKTCPAESTKAQTVAKFPSKPTAVTANIPTVVVAPETVKDSTTVSREMAHELLVHKDAPIKSETIIQSFPERLTDSKNEGQNVNKTQIQDDPSELQTQDQHEEEALFKPESLLTVSSGGNKISDKPQEGGLLSTLFSSLTSTTSENQAQQSAMSQPTGLFSGILKIAATENAGTGNKSAGAQQQPGNSEGQLRTTSPAGVQKHSQEEKATSQKGFLAGLFNKGSEEDSLTKVMDTTAFHINDENNSTVGKDLLTGIFKSEGTESHRTAISKDFAAINIAAPPQSGGFLSGLFKLANDTVSGSLATPAQQNSQPLLKPATTQVSNQPSPQTSTPPSHPGGLLSELLKLPGAENVCATGNVVTGKQSEQPENCGGQQPNNNQPNTRSNAPPVPPQSGGLFGRILKLTESTVAPLNTQQPRGTSSQPNQLSVEPSTTGGVQSGFINKTSVAESTSQQPHLPATSQNSKASQQSASTVKGGLVSGLFGISTSEASTGNQGSAQKVNSPQINRQNLVPHQEPQPSGRAGIISGLFNKIVDTSSQSGQSNGNQNSAQQPSPGLLSGLFSTNKLPAQQQKPPSGTHINHQQQQQGNRQPLQRQHQIQVQQAAAPEPKQGGLFSGLFNKFTAIDTPLQHIVADESPIQQTCRSGHPVQDHQSAPASKVQAEIFKTSTVTTASQKSSAERQLALSGLHPQTNRQAQQAPMAPLPPGAGQQQSQPGDILSSIFKTSASEKLQQGQAETNTQTSIKLETQDSDSQKSEILTGLFSKISAKTEDKSNSHVPLGQKPQQRKECKPVQSHPQIQRAKPLEQESTQDGGNEKDQKMPFQKNVLAGMFSKGSEDNTSSKLKETIIPKASFDAGKVTPSRVFKSDKSEKGFIDQLLHKQVSEDVSSVTSISGSKTSTQPKEYCTLHPAVKSTQQYLEEVHRLLYGTATEYGYQNLLYLFAEHGIVPPELYEHQCLIEALLWQQLNDYALLEALEAQAQEYYGGLQEDASSNSHVTVMREPGWWDLKNVDPRQFHVPSYPWQKISSSFQKQLPQANAEDDIVFDMSVKSRKCWGSCDNVNFINQASRNHHIKKDPTGTPAKVTRCQSLFDCSLSGTLKPQFDISKFVKRLTVKKGPIDLTVGAVNLCSSSAISRDIEDEMFFEDSEWYQQWLSLLEQGMWWPDEAGDCGYYIYADEEYIYSLLTDHSGKHLYAYSTQENRRDLEEIVENISNILQTKDKPKTTLCGFKIPLFNEDERLWVPCHSQGDISGPPVDLSSAFEKGDRIMNMNLKTFSEMLQDSMNGQTEHPVDLSVYKLQKIKVGKDETNEIHLSEKMEASDLTYKVIEVNTGGPYWKNQGIKDLFPMQVITDVTSNISSQTSLASNGQPFSIRCHSPVPEMKIGIVKETDNLAKTKDVEFSKMTVISNITNSNLSCSKTVPQKQHAQRKLPDDPVSSEAFTNSARAPTRSKVTKQPSIVTDTSSTITLLSPQKIISNSQCSSGSSSTTQLGRQSLMSTQSLKTSTTERVQSLTSSILPQPSKVIRNEKLPLPPPQSLLYNRPKQALDSLLRSKPLDFSEPVRNKMGNTGSLLSDLSNDNIINEDILDFTKHRLRKVRRKHQWTCQADINVDVGIDLTVEIKEEDKVRNMTFPALELTKPFLKTVSAPASAKVCPPDSEPSSFTYRTDQQSFSLPSIGPKLVRQVSVQCLKVSTAPEISGKKSINTYPKLSLNSPGSKADCGKDQKATYQGASSSQPTSPEIKKYLTVNMKSQSTQHIHQASLLNESIKITVTPPQLCCRFTAPAKLVRNTLDMSSAPVVSSLDKPYEETQVVPLIRSRRTSVADIGDGSFGVPLIVDSSTVKAKQIQSPAERTMLPLDEAESLVRRRIPSSSGTVEGFGGISLVVEPLATKIKSPQKRYWSHDTVTKPTQQMVNITSQIKSDSQHQTTQYNLALEGTMKTLANSSKAMLDMSVNSIPTITEGTVTSHTEMLSDVGKVKNVLGSSEKTVGMSSLMQHPTAEMFKPLLRQYHSIEAISQYSPQNAKENLMFLKPAGNTSSSKVVPLVENNPLFNITGPALGTVLPLDRSPNNLSQIKHSGVVNLVKTKSNIDVQVLQMSAVVPSMINTSEQSPKHDTLHIELSKNQWQKQAMFDQSSPGTPSVLLSSRSPGAQLPNISSAPANSIKNTLDMSLRTAITEPDRAAERVLPGKVMALVQTKNVISKKDLVGMPLAVKAISAPEQLFQKQLQAEKVLRNGHLCVQTSTSHSDRSIYPSVKQNGEWQVQGKPMDFSVRVLHSQCNDLSFIHDGQLIDFTNTKEGILRKKQRHQQRPRTTNQKNHISIIDLTVALGEKTQTSGIEDLSMPANSFLPGQYALTSLPMDLMLCTFQAFERQEPYITQSQNTYQTVQSDPPQTPTHCRRTAEHLLEPGSVLSVEQSKTTKCSFHQAQFTDNNLCLGKSINLDAPSVFRPVINSSEVPRMDQSPLFTSQAQHIGSFTQHDSLITQVGECNKSLEVSRSKGPVKQSAVKALSENTTQKWVPNRNSPTYLSEISHVLNTSKASDHTSEVTFVSGQDVSSGTSHTQEFNNMGNFFPAVSKGIPPCTTEQAVGQDMSQVTVISEVLLAQPGSACNGSSAEPRRKPLLAINTAPKTQVSSKQTLLEMENTAGSVKNLISKFDGITSIAGEDNISQRSEGIQQSIGSTCSPMPDQQMTPIPTHSVTSAKVTSVRKLVSVSMEDTSSATPASMVQSFMENPSASLACTAVPFVTACTFDTMARPGYTAPPPLEFLPTVPQSSAVHTSLPSVTYCPVKNLSSPVYVTSSATGYTAPPLIEFPLAVPPSSVAHTAGPSMTYGPGDVATTAVKSSPPLPLSSPGYMSSTPVEFSAYTVEAKTSRTIEPLPLPLHPPSLMHEGEPCSSVKPPVCTSVTTTTCSVNVVPLPIKPTALLFPSTKHIKSPAVEFSSPILQNMSHTVQQPIVFSNDKQCSSSATGVLDKSSQLLQRKKIVYHQSNISRQVSKAPTIIITEVEVESQEPSLLMLAQAEIPEKEADLMSKTHCELSLMTSDNSMNTTSNTSNSAVTVNNTDITRMSQQIIPTHDHLETCSQSSKSQETVHATELALKEQVSEGWHTDSDMFSQKQPTDGSILPEMISAEEISCYAAVSPAEVIEKTSCFTRLHPRQKLIPHITLKHPKGECPGDSETMSLHETKNDACVSDTKANEDTKQHSVLFESSETPVSVHEKPTLCIDEIQVDSSAIILPVAFTEVSECNINVSANTFTSYTPNFPNSEELVQDTTSHKEELPLKNESILIKSDEGFVNKNKDIFSLEQAPVIMDITSQLVMSPEDAKEKSELEDQKLSHESSETAKTMIEEDDKVSAIFIKEPFAHNEQHLTLELPKPENKERPSGLDEIADMSNEQESVQDKLHKLSSLETQVPNTGVLSMESTLPPSAVPEEQSGKGFFTLFGGSSSTSSQTQSGSSILGGILSGASASKETTGTSLFSMFGGDSHQQSPASSPKEIPGKNLFSMFTGSNVQQPLGLSDSLGPSPRSSPGHDTREQVMSGPIGTHDNRGGPVPGSKSPPEPSPRGSFSVGLLPRGQQPKDFPGKGLFSMFTSPSTQQTLASGASSRSPASGSPNLGGNLPVTSTPKDNTGSGLFSMFGGSSAESFTTQTGNKCSNKEPAGKGLFSRLGGSASAESESLFKVPSVFSLGGSTDKPKLSGFGLLSFMDDKKSTEPLPEDKTTIKPKDISRDSTSVNSEIKDVQSSHVKPKDNEQNVSNNPVSTANENYENISSVSTETNSSYAILNYEDGKIPKDKTTGTSELTHGHMTEESETEIKTVEHHNIEKQQSLEPKEIDKSVTDFQIQEDDVAKDKTLATFEFTLAHIPEKSETDRGAVEHLTEKEIQKLESLVAEKPLDCEQNHSKELESDTGKETGTRTYFVQSPKAEKSETHLKSEKADESDETIEAWRPQKLNKLVDYADHFKTGEITLDELQTRELVNNTILTGIDEIPENLENETKNQDPSGKGSFEIYKETDHADQPKNYLCDGVIEKEPAQVKEQVGEEKHLTDMPAQIVSEPLSAVIIQPQPQSLPELIGSLEESKPRMLQPSDHHRQNVASFQKPPNSAAFSGFMSMFSGPSAPSKSATSSFFSSPQHSFFKLQPTGATCTQQQHKASFFNLSTNLPAGLATDSLKGDLFSLLKTKDAAGQEQTKSVVETGKIKTEDSDGAKNFTKAKSSIGKDTSTDRAPEAVTSEQKIVKGCERSDVEPVEEVRGEARGDNVEVTDMIIKQEESETDVIKEETFIAVTSPIPVGRVVTQEKHPSSPTAKGIFDFSGLSSPPFGGLLSSAAETAKPFSSLFGSSTETKLPQQPSDSGSLFASLKGLSAGLFQEEKSALPNEEPMSAPSMFGNKLGFPWQSTAPSQAPATVVIAQVEKKNDNEEPDIEIMSLESDVTESPDSSDIEGPTDTCSDKQQSFDSSAETLLAIKQDMSKLEEEDEAEADSSLKEKEQNATDHAMGQLPESPLENEHGRRLVGT